MQPEVVLTPIFGKSHVSSRRCSALKHRLCAKGSDPSARTTQSSRCYVLWKRRKHKGEPIKDGDIAIVAVVKCLMLVAAQASYATGCRPSLTYCAHPPAQTYTVKKKLEGARKLVIELVCRSMTTRRPAAQLARNHNLDVLSLSLSLSMFSSLGSNGTGTTEESI